MLLRSRGNTAGDAKGQPVEMLEGPGMFVYDFLVLSNIVPFFSFLLLLSLCIRSQAGYKFGLLYTFIIIPLKAFVLCCGSLMEADPSHLTI